MLLGDDYPCTIKGYGNTRFKMHDVGVRLLTNVRYIPGLKRTLILLGLLVIMGSSKVGVL